MGRAIAYVKQSQLGSIFGPMMNSKVSRQQAHQYESNDPTPTQDSNQIAFTDAKAYPGLY